jgi:hypothetical protein
VTPPLPRVCAPSAAQRIASDDAGQPDEPNGQQADRRKIAANEAEATASVRRRHPLRALASYAAFSLLLLAIGLLFGLAVGFVGAKWISPPRALSELFAGH